MDEIREYMLVMVAPDLVINEKLVYDLWIPSKDQGHRLDQGGAAKVGRDSNPATSGRLLKTRV